MLMTPTLKKEYRNDPRIRDIYGIHQEGIVECFSLEVFFNVVRPSESKKLNCIYGVADNFEQILEKYSHLVNDAKLKMCIAVRIIDKAAQPATGGWRWHKWGEYIGNKYPQYEYLHDEDESMTQVVCYEVFEIL